ncbi:uncharacterized protein LOC134855576 [Symsagittifera roscoffensis]|uniref:uncharacterized protein LOC134855576 n=1 Tax=Symsagittifera roscoffensis TaxID=84072 RepID=UPI00307BFFC8
MCGSIVWLCLLMFGSGSFGSILVPSSLDWESMLFIIPSDYSSDVRSHLCHKYSTRFCFMGKVINAIKSERSEEDDDYFNFIELISRVYRHINWFSISYVFVREEGTCCLSQLGSYRKFGMERGLSPDSYMNEVTDFSSRNKKLNFIKAHFNRNLCVNLISEVGFGTGELVIFGEYHNAFFLLNEGNNKMFHFFPYNNIKDQLTFEWFKLNIMCDEQPWICVTHPPPVAEQLL